MIAILTRKNKFNIYKLKIRNKYKNNPNMIKINNQNNKK